MVEGQKTIVGVGLSGRRGGGFGQILASNAAAFGWKAEFRAVTLHTWVEAATAPRSSRNTTLYYCRVAVLKMLARSFWRYRKRQKKKPKTKLKAPPTRELEIRGGLLMGGGPEKPR